MLRTASAALATGLVLALILPAVAGVPIDTDGDGVPDEDDNCPTVVNPSQLNSEGDAHGDACDNCTERINDSQCDTNEDGYGNLCDGDYNQDNVGGIPDLTGYLIPNFNMTTTTVGGFAGPDIDGNCDNVVGLPDFTLTWKPNSRRQQGPSGLPCAGPAGGCPPVGP